MYGSTFEVITRCFLSFLLLKWLAEYSAVPETPEAKRTRKQSYFKPRRGVKFLDGSSDSDSEEPRNFCAAKENRAPRRNVAVMYV